MSPGGLGAGIRRYTGRRGQGAELPERLAALEAAVDLAKGRLEPSVLGRAEDVVGRASQRLAITGDHTVVALAGATGSGKSSLFNALAGRELSQVGVRRPTTSVTTAATWGEAGDVLGWLEVPSRHQVDDGESASESRLAGLVLLDLPDHDSTEIAHHVEVDRLVAMVDLLVWVLDPQKYADAAVHERYLRPLRTHREVMLVVLNHLDEVPPGQADELVSDLTRLLQADGLEGVGVIGTSAVTGHGVADLKEVLASRVEAKRASVDRLSADVHAAATAMRELNGEPVTSGVGRQEREELVASFAEAAGVPTVVEAVQRSVTRRGAARTGWPFTTWLARLRPDPLKRLHLDLGTSGKALTGVNRASLPAPTTVQRARVETAVRGISDAAGQGLPSDWSAAVRRASLARGQDLDDSLDRAVAGTDLGASRVPLWWRIGRGLQLLLAAAALAGALWLGALVLLGYFQLLVPDPPEQSGVPLPTLLLVGGLVSGLAFALLARVVNRWVGRSRARLARRRLTAAITAVAEELVVQPIEAELAARSEVARLLDVAVG